MKIKIDRPLAVGSKNWKFVECANNEYIYETDEATAKLVLSLRFAKSKVIEEDKPTERKKKKETQATSEVIEQTVEVEQTEQVID